ncbi:GNAT family N-acetyltransferase [Curvibacter sp. CHRR-16]|uniref:GNAT family N-acetyltransferase n=1 Tax=Curvibacter sp. CHRR-16 TaxID=2835872 RepID=UPI001BDAB6C9|nr:GNAT family N-acetyltransferase [Curvibacter sp. CHRR-16]MBT0570888.1 GNAT family N-acetyltransferase [Curvibacter sp. CHRR-16]
MTTLFIRHDNLSDPRIEAFMQEHLRDMYAASPPESVHALDMNKLRQPGILFYSAWDALDAPPEATLLATGALKLLDEAGHGEIKSMRTHAQRRGQGLAGQMLLHILNQARARGLQRVSLETGTQDFFAPARQLYLRHGFVPCEPFADYQPDPYSAFFTLAL